VDDRDLWDPVMLEDYLAGIELGVDGDQVLEFRRRVLDRLIPMLILTVSILTITLDQISIIISITKKEEKMSYIMNIFGEAGAEALYLAFLIFSIGLC